MNWEAVSATAELIGGLAVIVTLVYLSVQVRQSNRQESATAVKEAFSTFMDAFAALTENESKAENFRAGINRFDELPPTQQSMFHSKMQSLGNGYYQVWTLHKSGMLTDEDLFKRSRNVFLAILRTPGGRQWWTEWKHMPPQPYIRDLEQLISDPASEVIPMNEDWSWFKDSEQH